MPKRHPPTPCKKSHILQYEGIWKIFVPFHIATCYNTNTRILRHFRMKKVENSLHFTMQNVKTIAYSGRKEKKEVLKAKIISTLHCVQGTMQKKLCVLFVLLVFMICLWRIRLLFLAAFQFWEFAGKALVEPFVAFVKHMFFSQRRAFLLPLGIFLMFGRMRLAKPPRHA